MGPQIVVERFAAPENGQRFSVGSSGTVTAFVRNDGDEPGLVQMVARGTGIAEERSERVFAPGESNFVTWRFTVPNRASFSIELWVGNESVQRMLATVHPDFDAEFNFERTCNGSLLIHFLVRNVGDGDAYEARIDVELNNLSRSIALGAIAPGQEVVHTERFEVSAACPDEASYWADAIVSDAGRFSRNYLPSSAWFSNG